MAAKLRPKRRASTSRSSPSVDRVTFDILTDLHLKTSQQFGLVFVLPDYLRDLYKSHGMTLDQFNDESGYRLPMPARYIIDQGRTIVERR